MTNYLVVLSWQDVFMPRHAENVSRQGEIKKYLRPDEIKSCHDEIKIPTDDLKSRADEIKLVLMI